MLRAVMIGPCGFSLVVLHGDVIYFYQLQARAASDCPMVVRADAFAAILLRDPGFQIFAASRYNLNCLDR